MRIAETPLALRTALRNLDAPPFISDGIRCNQASISCGYARDPPTFMSSNAVWGPFYPQSIAMASSTPIETSSWPATIYRFRSIYLLRVLALTVDSYQLLLA